MFWSLAIAFIVTPWASIRILRWGRKYSALTEGAAPRPRPRKPHSPFRARGGFLHPALPPHHGAADRPAALALAFLAGITVLLLGAMATVGIGWVKVKMLPFDNKSEFQVILNMPEGSALERTAQAAREMAAAVRNEPEVTDYQVYAGVAAPFNFNGLVRHYFMRRGAHVADIQVNLVPKDERKAQSHDIAKRVRPRVAAIAAKYGARVAVAEVPPGPPVLQTLVAEIYGPDEESRLALARKVIDIFKQHPAWWTWIGISRPTSRRPASSSTRKRPRCTASAPRPSRRRCASPSAAQSVDLLHLPREKEDVDIVLRTAASPAAPRPEELLALRVRSGDANALPEPGAPAPPLVPLRELVRVEHDHRGQEHLPQEPDAGDLCHRRRGRRGRKPGLCHPQDEPGAARNSTRREFGGSGAPLKIFNAVQPFTDDEPAMKWDGEWHITIEVFRDLGIGLRRRAGADLHPDGRLVPLVPHAADRHGGDSVLAGRHPAGARRCWARFSPPPR